MPISRAVIEKVIELPEMKDTGGMLDPEAFALMIEFIVLNKIRQEVEAAMNAINDLLEPPSEQKAGD